MQYIQWTAYTSVTENIVRAQRLTRNKTKLCVTKDGTDHPKWYGNPCEEDAWIYVFCGFYIIELLKVVAYNTKSI